MSGLSMTKRFHSNLGKEDSSNNHLAFSVSNNRGSFEESKANNGTSLRRGVVGIEKRVTKSFLIKDEEAPLSRRIV